MQHDTGQSVSLCADVSCLYCARTYATRALTETVSEVVGSCTSSLWTLPMTVVLSAVDVASRRWKARHAAAGRLPAVPSAGQRQRRGAGRRLPRILATAVPAAAAAASGQRLGAAVRPASGRAQSYRCLDERASFGLDCRAQQLLLLCSASRLWPAITWRCMSRSCLAASGSVVWCVCMCIGTDARQQHGPSPRDGCGVVHGECSSVCCAAMPQHTYEAALEKGTERMARQGS